MLRGRYKHIDFLRLLFLVGMIDDLPFIAAKLGCLIFYNEFCHAGPSFLVFLQDVKSHGW